MKQTRSGRAWWLFLMLMGLLAVGATEVRAQIQNSPSKIDLQGQDKGDPTWKSGNLENWVELDYVPARVFFSEPVSNQTITIYFPHLIGTTPGFQNLVNFTASSNAIITSGPTLNTDPSGVWSYTFVVSITNNDPGYVQFLARLAAGSHINPGSSLQLSGDPSSMGNLQIHKPGAGPGLPDLKIVKTGPASIAQGDTILYTLSYTNKASTNTAVGTQISDIFPASLMVDSNTLPANASLVGNTIFWDLTNVAPHASGTVTFSAFVPWSVSAGTVLTNFSQILSSEDDAFDSDNTSTWLTTVIAGCIAPIVTNPPSSTVVCAGDAVAFSVAHSGTGPFTYQWRKDGSNIPTGTNSTYNIGTASTGDAGSYDVIVSNACGTNTSTAATLTVNEGIVIVTPPAGSTNCPGTAALFSVGATGTGLSYQWYKGAVLLGGETGSSLTINPVSAGDAGTYSVVVSGTCGSPVTNSAVLVVNQNVVVVTPPSNSTNCPGTTAIFSVSATGTGLSYQWFKGVDLLGETSSTLTLTGVSASDAATYTVIVSGTCGNSVTNSAVLVVNESVSVAPLANVTKQVGQSVTFTAVASGTGPLSYVWKKGGSTIGGATGSSLTLTNLSLSDSGVYSVEVTGACGEPAVTSATLTVNEEPNQPPTIAITYPTNGAVYVAPATFTVLAEANDSDGTVTNVTLLQSTNGVDFVEIGQGNSATLALVLSNLTAGTYTFKAVATDDDGATGVSTLVTVTVIAAPPLSQTGLKFNPQDGLWHLTSVVSNPSSTTLPSVRLLIYGITNPVTVFNPTGTTNGIPFVQSAAILPGAKWTNTIKIYVPVGGVVPNVTLVAQVFGAPSGGPGVVGTPQAIDRGLFLVDGTFMVQFTTVVGKNYYIQYSGDLIHWTTVQPPLAGNGSRVIWIDSGPPETESLPTIDNARFYRVLVTP